MCVRYACRCSDLSADVNLDGKSAHDYAPRRTVIPSSYMYRRLSAMNRHLTADSREENGAKLDICSDAEPLFSECDLARPLKCATEALVLAATSAVTAALPPPLPAGEMPSRETALGLVRPRLTAHRFYMYARPGVFHSGVPR